MLKLAIAITTLVLSVASCGSDDDCTADNADSQSWLTITGNDFDKSCVKVAAGTLFTITNRDMAAHSLTTRKTSSESFATGALNKDASFSHTFAGPGTVKVYSAEHDGLEATIIVQQP